MSETSYKIDQSLFNALNGMKNISFSARQLKQEFCTKFGPFTAEEHKRIQKWIYSQLSRLIRLGFLERKKAKNPRLTTYKKLEGFIEASFYFFDGPFTKLNPIEKAFPEAASIIQHVDDISKSPIVDLKNRAKQRHVDLLSAIGESEEYLSLFKAYPSLRQVLKPKYQQALESSSKLLGQLRAIETALEYYKVKQS